MIFESESPGALDGESIRTLRRNLVLAFDDLAEARWNLRQAGDAERAIWEDKAKMCEERIGRMREELGRMNGGAKCGG